VGYTDDLNLYAYVYNDPLDKTDPTGLDGGCIYTGGCEVFAGAAAAFPLSGSAEQLDKGNYLAAAGLFLLDVGGGEGKYTKAAANLLEKIGKSFGEAVQRSVKSFLKGHPIPTKTGTIEAKALPNEGVAVQATKAGDVPGSKAVYEKQIDSEGNTVQSTKTTYDPQGNIVHVKDKLTGETHAPPPPPCTFGDKCPHQ